MNPIIQVALTQLPDILRAFKDLFHAQHPTEPVPTDAEVIAAYQAALAASLAADAAWLAAHDDPAQ